METYYICSIVNFLFNFFLLLVGRIDIRLGNDFLITNVMLIILLKINAFITTLYGYGSNYQHNYSLRALTLIETIRIPDKRGLNHLDSLSHILRIRKVNISMIG